MIFSVSIFPVLNISNFSKPKSIVYSTKFRISPCLLSPDMHCIVFPLLFITI